MPEKQQAWDEPTRYVLQDGAEFYLYTDADCKDYLRCIESPFRVGDFDMPAATIARNWFVKYYPQHVFAREGDE